jgi:DNA modification methylase
MILDITTQPSNPNNEIQDNQTASENQFLIGEQTRKQVDPISGHTVKEWHSGTPIRWQLYCGQAKEALRLIEDSSIDCVITSPPYFWLRDYKVNGQIGLEESVDGYVVAITDVMTEIYRILKPEGTLFLNLGDTYYSGKGESQGVDKKSAKRRFGLRAVDKSGGLGIGLQRKSIIGIPWRVALKMCQQNWVLRSPIIWHRLKSLAEVVKDRPARGYEYIFLFAKSRRYYFSKDGLPQNGTAEDVWSIPARTKLNGARDTAPFPDELVERCIAVGCPPGGKILDPFCGSGTTMRVAIQQNHPVIGIELNEDFCIYIRKDLESIVK